MVRVINDHFAHALVAKIAWQRKNGGMDGADGDALWHRRVEPQLCHERAGCGAWDLKGKIFSVRFINCGRAAEGKKDLSATLPASTPNSIGDGLQGDQDFCLMARSMGWRG